MLEAIQSVNWDVDLNCVGAKSPWYLSNGELIMWKDSNDKEKHLEFLESIYGPVQAPHHKAEPQLKIMSKFDRQEIEAKEKTREKQEEEKEEEEEKAKEEKGKETKEKAGD